MTLTLSALCVGAVAGCGEDDDKASPKSLRQQLLPASQFPGFKSQREFNWDNAIDFAVEGLLLPESTPRSRAVEALEDAGFEAGVGEALVPAKANPFEGSHAQQEVVQLGSGHDARTAREYARKEALKPPCFGSCSVEASEFGVAGIPGAKGARLKPQRNPPPNSPPPFESFAIAFTIGSRLYLVHGDGGPGQVKKSQVVSVAKALYKRNAKTAAAD